MMMMMMMMMMMIKVIIMTSLTCRENKQRRIPRANKGQP